jgi:hypothetical protein
MYEFYERKSSIYQHWLKEVYTISHSHCENGNGILVDHQLC